MRTTDFFAAKRRAQAQSSRWRIVFLLTAVLMSILVGYSASIIFAFMMNLAGTSPPDWMNHLYLIIAAFVLFVILVTSIFQSIRIRRTGLHELLLSSGAKLIASQSADQFEKL